jgi:hypothetical protein
MGYITSGSTNDGILEVCFTPLGMQYISQGLGDKLTVKYFGLGDTDSNYMISKRLCMVPDITGIKNAERGYILTEYLNGKKELIPNTSCAVPTIQDDIKYKISLNGDTTLIPRELIAGTDYCI